MIFIILFKFFVWFELCQLANLRLILLIESVCKLLLPQGILKTNISLSFSFILNWRLHLFYYDLITNFYYTIFFFNKFYQYIWL